MDEMRERIVAAAKRHKIRCGEFVRELVALPSPSRGEEQIAQAVRREMLKIGYPEAEVDRFGNVIGKIGDGRTKIIFDAHLDTAGIGDRSSWRFMVKSAARAMDALQTATKKNKNPLKRFVVTGASKRGWTAWLTGAIQDKRVIGIAPMVFDNLNFKAQLKHQLESWGKYSEMIGDYIERGLDQIVETPQGTHLVAMVDPYTYRERITIPKLIVNGANDRYWTVDALSLYWQGLAEPKYCSIVPNAGHGLGDMNQALHAIAAFARSCAGEFEFPHVRGGVGEEKSQWGPLIDTEKPEAVRAVRFWSVRADTWDFRDSQWQPVAGQQLESNNHSTKYIYVKKTGVPGAVFAEAEYEINGIRFVLSTPVSLLKENRGKG